MPAQSPRYAFVPASRVRPAETSPQREVQTPAPSPRIDLRPGDIDLGTIEHPVGRLGLDLGKLLDGRLLIQGASGAGKSWTLRRIVENAAGLVQQIVVDPEGEFEELTRHCGLLRVDGATLDAAALAIAAQRIREHRISVLLDLSEVVRENQMIAIAAFFNALVEAPRHHWHPCLVLVDEAHLFAPFGGQSDAPSSVRKAAIGAVTDLMSRGRKRGLAGVLATQRLARLSKSVASEVHNFLIGLNTLDLDIRRAAETIGWDARKAFDRLPLLTPGDFVAVGPGFTHSPSLARIADVVTRHRSERPPIEKPDRVPAEQAAQLLELDALREASAVDQLALEDDRSTPGHRSVRLFMRDRKFPLAAQIWSALRPLHPNGATITLIAQHCESSIDDVAEAVALLDVYGALEMIGEGEDRIVRAAKVMLP